MRVRVTILSRTTVFRFDLWVFDAGFFVDHGGNANSDEERQTAKYTARSVTNSGNDDVGTAGRGDERREATDNGKMLLY